MSGEAWDYPDPFTLEVTVSEDVIDLFGHANHTAYHRWFADAAWHHSREDGLAEQLTQDEQAGMAIRRSEVDYLAHVRAGDRLWVAVWITFCDGKLRAERRFQARRMGDGVTVARGRWDLVCFDLRTGRPRRMPDSFRAHYRTTP